MKAEAVSPQSARDFSPGTLPEAPDPLAANPLRLLHRENWCQPEDLLFHGADPQKTGESEPYRQQQVLRQARYAVRAPEELAVALCFATEDLLPAGSARDGAEPSVLQANRDLCASLQAPRGSLRRARLLTDAIEAWDAGVSRDHLHAMNIAVYEMTGIAVNERRLRDRINTRIRGLVAQFLEEIPAELAMRHILFLKTMEDARFLPLFELDNFPFYRPMADHIRSLADFLKLSTWLLESPRFVANGPETPEEVDALMSTAQDCREDLDFWAEQPTWPRPAENLSREIRTRIVLLALIVALRSRMWQDAARLINGLQPGDLREEKEDAGRQTLQFTLELVPLVARHQIEPITDLDEQFTEARRRMPEVGELIEELREAFCAAAEPQQQPDAQSEEIQEVGMDAPPLAPLPQPRRISLHAMPETPLPPLEPITVNTPAAAETEVEVDLAKGEELIEPIEATPPRHDERRHQRRKVVARFVEKASRKIGSATPQPQPQLHKIRPRNLESDSDALKDVETAERRRLLGKRVADFEKSAGSRNHRRTDRPGGALLSRLKNPHLLTLSAVLTALLVLGGAGFFLSQIPGNSAAAPVVADASAPVTRATSGSREIDLVANDHGRPAELLSGYHKGQTTRSGQQPTLPPDAFQVKKIIYFSEAGQTGEVKAAHINDWVYREGEELVDFSTGARVAFQVVKIEPSQVILRNQAQELQLPLLTR